MTSTLSREQAIELDNGDGFRSKRNQFDLPEDVINLCGNSPGPMPGAAAKIKKSLEEDRASCLVSSWTKACEPCRLTCTPR